MLLLEWTLKDSDFSSDVKPSNILINKLGEIKLCDFGIAGELVNSFLATDIGCKPYLAPERINPVQSGAKYDQRSDVWSYGITMVRLYYWLSAVLEITTHRVKWLWEGFHTQHGRRSLTSSSR